MCLRRMAVSVGVSLLVLAANEAFAAKLARGSTQAPCADSSDETWCVDNRWPDGGPKKVEAKGVARFQNILPDGFTQILRATLQNDQDWEKGVARWEFKTKVSSEYNYPLKFGFPADGGYFNFTVPANAGDADESGSIAVNDIVRMASEVDLEYRGEEPKGLYDLSITFSDFCLRPMLCSRFKGCAPVYNYRNYQTGTGYTMGECCEPIYCKNSDLNMGWNATCRSDEHGATAWTYPDDFDTRMGNTLQRCCVGHFCTNECDGTKYKPKGGHGIMGTNVEDCCDPLYCWSNESICDIEYDMSPLPVKHENGSSRLGSVEEDCCNMLNCDVFPCQDSPHGKWANRSNVSGRGHTFQQCCDPVFCSDWSCENKSKWKAKSLTAEELGKLQGGVDEICCEMNKCEEYECKTDGFILDPSLLKQQGGTDDECCIPMTCEMYECVPTTHWVKKPKLKDNADGQKVTRYGYRDVDCCEPVYCRDFDCLSSTKWKSRNYSSDNMTQGSSFEECCDTALCKDWTCTSDYDGDGNGTMYYKKRDTNGFFFQGRSDEECCYHKLCSQYITRHPSKWERKQDDEDQPLLGSTDPECYNPRYCSKWLTDLDNSKQCDDAPFVGQIPEAEKILGSTATECCSKA
eukprot:TRINITY_DN90660_c0_g1_i1.p1 TRINITY_DN90660_c0_g1~~TRINITY_DN90660_c0_g1_i1.p1  ORF type:complete len:631 (-),score=120.12 TRINITY_DN90660_c0_g1_i1:66-1958(-)